MDLTWRTAAVCLAATLLVVGACAGGDDAEGGSSSPAPGLIPAADLLEGDQRWSATRILDGEHASLPAAEDRGPMVPHLVGVHPRGGSALVSLPAALIKGCEPGSQAKPVLTALATVPLDGGEARPALRGEDGCEDADVTFAPDGTALITKASTVWRARPTPRTLPVAGRPTTPAPPLYLYRSAIGWWHLGRVSDTGIVGRLRELPRTPGANQVGSAFTGAAFDGNDVVLLASDDQGTRVLRLSGNRWDESARLPDASVAQTRVGVAVLKGGEVVAATTPAFRVERSGTVQRLEKLDNKALMSAGMGSAVIAWGDVLGGSSKLVAVTARDINRPPTGTDLDGKWITAAAGVSRSPVAVVGWREGAEWRIALVPVPDLDQAVVLDVDLPEQPAQLAVDATGTKIVARVGNELWLLHRQGRH